MFVVSSMHNVTLTSEEQEVILDYAARLQKRSRQWRVFRWLSVGCFILGIGLLFAVVRLSDRMRSAIELPPEALKIPENAGSKLVASSLEMIAAHGDAQVAVLRAEFFLVLKALMVAGVGTALFVHAVSDWRRDRRDRVVARLLRSVAASDTGDKEHES
jgi:hypothetical protein